MREPMRMQAVQSPIIPIVGEMIRKHPGTISLGQGVVNYGPPPESIAKIERFYSDPDNNKYKAVRGIPPLIAAIAAKLDSENRIQIGPDNSIVVTAGANMGFMNAVLAITDPGDEIILPSPYYFNQEMAVTIASCKPVLVETDDNYQLRSEAIKQAITARTRAVVTISPNNPTGAVYPESALRQVNDICRQHDIYHICDEAYEYFTFNGARHFSPGAIHGSSPHTISLFSLSKAYGFASWRIGYMVIPAHLLDSIMKIQDTILICPPVISQYAALGALETGSGYCRSKLGAIGEVRQILLDELGRLGPACTVPKTDGAFYFLIRLDTKLDAMALVERLVREHRVAVIPGPAFGAVRGCYLRISYGALDKQTAAEGIGRLVRGLRTL